MIEQKLKNSGRPSETIPPSSRHSPKAGIHRAATPPRRHDRLEGDAAQTGDHTLMDLALVGRVEQVPAEGNQKDLGDKHPCGKHAHDKYQN